MVLKPKSKKRGQYSVEKGFVSKLVETGDFKTLKDQQIRPSFLTGDNRRVFQYIMDTFKQTRECPTPRVLGQKFPSYTLETHAVDGVESVGTDESLIYWCNELRLKTKHNRTADILEEAAQCLEEGDAEAAYSKLKQGVWSIEDEVVLTSGVDITKNTADRKEAYLKRKESHGMQGIPTGIDHLDFLMKGLVDETVTTVIANTGIGKTWFLVLLASYAMLNNYKVCVFITEMSVELMQDRFDAMLFGMTNGVFNYSNFKSGLLDMETENKYFEFLEEDLPRLEPLIIETATGISSVVSVIEREKPDIVFIDGVYLMEDEQGAKDDWLRVAHITRDVKKTAKNWHLPIVINTQADKNTSKKTGPELESIMYTQAIGQDSDNVLALFRDEIMFNDHEMGVKLLKQREGTLGKAIINWDFSTMNFTSIYSAGDAEPGEEAKEAPKDDRIMSVD